MTDLPRGSTMRAAVKAVRQHRPSKVVVGVPTGAAETCEGFRHEADEVVCVIAPAAFNALGAWYEGFPEIGDDEARDILEKSSRELVNREHYGFALALSTIIQGVQSCESEPIAQAPPWRR
jgi:predicted phosphoribosyltransferase